jgi:hypothetical protein
MKSTAEAIINFLNTLRGFAELFEKETWAELGYEADLNLKLGTGVSSNQKVVEFIKVLADELAEIALIGTHPPKSIKGYKPIFTSGKTIFEKARELQDFDDSSTGSDASFSDIGEQLGFKIFKKLNPVTYAIMDLLNLFDEQEKDDAPKKDAQGKFLRFAHKETRFQTANIGKAPTAIVKDTYFSGDGSPDLLVEKIKNLALALGIPVTFGIKPVDEIGDLDAKTRALLGKNLSCWFTIGDDLLFGCSFIGVKKGEIGNDDPLVLVTPIAGLTGFEQSVGDWDFAFAVSEAFPAFYFNDKEIRSASGSGSENFSTSFKLVKKRGKEEGLAFLFGSNDGTRLQIAETGVEIHLFLSQQAEQFKATLAVQKGKFVFDRGDGDGLLKKLLPDKGVEFGFDFKLNYSNSKGFYFEGQAGTELVIPAGLKIGSAFTLPEIQLGFKVTDKHGLGIFASLSGQTKLGPILLEIGRTGVQFDVLPKETGKPAALGFADADIRFKPPSEIGLAVEAKIIEGGGFLSFDVASGNYFGVAFLTLKHKFEIKAIAVIQTRMPDGSEGFSLLLIITFELPTTQPGMGFRLEGVGGIIGIHRTIDREALLLGMRDNTLDNILFPDDPVKNAAVIFRQSTAVFPAAEGSHTFGLMFLLAWGSKSLVQLKLGLILKYQDPTIIVLLGVLKIGVEKMVLGKKIEVFRLQVNFKADYEEGKYFAFDAGLYKSKFLGFQLLGELCVRWKGEPDPYFLFSAGGFHPDFQPPALNIPKNIQRLKFVLADSESVKINGYAYLAVSSNTLQVGGGFEAYINVWKLSIEGKLGFDAIFYRSGNPSFKASANGQVSVKIWGFTLGGIKAKGEISGTTPWHFVGSVSFEIGWWDYTKSVDKTWGEEGEDRLETVTLLALIGEELETPDAWTPVRRRFLQGVTIRTLHAVSPGQFVLAHPDESLQVRQAVLPLGVPLDHFGHFKIADHRTFELRLSSGPDAQPISVATNDTSDFFAPAEFFELTEDQRLSRKSYESFKAGFEAQGLDKLTTGDFREMSVAHERKLIDDEAPPPPPEPVTRPLPPLHFVTQIRRNAIAASALGKRAARTVRQDFRLQGEQFGVVTQAMGVVDLSQGTLDSEAEAQVALNNLLKRNPALKEPLVVVPVWEMD